MHIMLDIETLGTEPGCVILLIGAVAFDPFGDILNTPKSELIMFYQNIEIIGQLLVGLKINKETMKWWREQNTEAKTALTGNHMDIDLALTEFKEWKANLPSGMSVKGDHKIWAKSPDFDCAIIEHAFKVFEHDVPWTFRQKADVRTVDCVADMIKRNPRSDGPPWNPSPPLPVVGNHHNALDDCINQIARVQQVMRGLRDATSY